MRSDVQFLTLCAVGMAVAMMLVYLKALLCTTNCKTCRTILRYWAILVIRASPSFSHHFFVLQVAKKSASIMRTRNLIEKGSGIWKRQFPILKYGLRVKLENCPNIIVVCIVLHNTTIHLNKEIFSPDAAENGAADNHCKRRAWKYCSSICCSAFFSPLKNDFFYAPLLHKKCLVQLVVFSFLSMNSIFNNENFFLIHLQNTSWNKTIWWRRQKSIELSEKRFY